MRQSPVVEIPPDYSAGRRDDAATAGLPVRTPGPGWFQVPSRSGVKGGYHITPSMDEDGLRLRCSCSSGQARWRAQLPCVHAAAVMLLLEARGLALWLHVEMRAELDPDITDSERRTVLGDEGDTGNEPEPF